jgi:glycosyltransferase involved in cell wall biosynthesis
VTDALDFHVILADSPVTRQKGMELGRNGQVVSFYKHFNVNFARRNLYRMADRLLRHENRTLPWFDRILNEKCDLVWFNAAALADLKELIYAVKICKQAGKPYYIILQHAYENFCPATEADLDAVRKVVSDARRFVFISERNRRSLERGIAIRLENAFQSTNALTPQKIAEASRAAEDAPVGADDGARFICLGRFSAVDKGQHLLIEALGGRDWAKRDWRLTFTGISAYGEKYLRGLADDYRIDTSKITFQSFTENVFEAICDNDVVVMPSLAEGMPYAMIEGMACARPAIGTPVGGIPELIEEGRTGWLARTTDVADVADALERAWRDRTKWREMGREAQLAVA